MKKPAAVLALLASMHAGPSLAQLTICPIAPFTDAQVAPRNLRVVEVKTGRVLTDFDALMPQEVYEFQADNPGPSPCADTRLDIEVQQSLGYPTFVRSDKLCHGSACTTHNIQLTMPSGRALYWQARFFRQDRCTVDDHCDTPVALAYNTGWITGPTLRSKEYWGTPVVQVIGEVYLQNGKPLGDPSEGNLSHGEDGKFMTFGSAPETSGVQSVRLITPFPVVNRFNVVDGEVFFVSKASADCTQTLTVHDSVDNRDVVLETASLKAGVVHKSRLPLLGGLRRYVTPVHNVINKSGQLALTSSCVGASQAFEFGADFIGANIVSLPYDESGDRD